MMENNWLNPFTVEVRDLVNVSTDCVAPPDIAKDLLRANAIGEDAYDIQAAKIRFGYTIGKIP